MIHVLHINDNNLQLTQGDQTVRSQGYAWIKDGGVVFDLDGTQNPVKHCRLAPQEINNRYWQACEQSAIPNNSAGMRHSADLIWQHLNQLKQQHTINQVALVAPSHYREANLQLLLGVAKACGLEVTGLLNKAVLALQSQGLDDGDYAHIDVQLHQTVCSRVHVKAGVVKLGDVDVLQDVGIHAMQEALLKGFQASFIQNDRFDPLHDAATEQQLFDQLEDIALTLADSGKANVGLQHQSRLHSTTVDSKEWQSILKPFTDVLVSTIGLASASFVDLNTAFANAELEALSAAGFTHISETPSVSEFLSDATSGDALIYKTELQSSSVINAAVTKAERLQPVKNPQPTESPQRAASNSPQSEGATHLLLAGKAIAIEHAQVGLDAGQLGLRHSDDANLAQLLSAGKVFIMNDEGRTSLKPNDRLGSHLADGVIMVIQVV